MWDPCWIHGQNRYAGIVHSTKYMGYMSRRISHALEATGDDLRMAIELLSMSDPADVAHSNG